MHYREFLLLEYSRGIYLIVKVNQEKKVCKFVFFFLQINYVWGSDRSIERIKLNDRLNKDIRLQALCENTFSSLTYTRNLIELLKNFLFSYSLHVTMRKSLDGSSPDKLGKLHMSRILNYFYEKCRPKIFLVDIFRIYEVPESRFASYCKLLMSHFRKLYFKIKST